MTEVLRLCRRVLRELQKIDPQARTGQFWRYIRAEVTSSTTHSDVSPHELNKLQTCATYLESSRRHRELLVEYGGRGERSVQDAAHLVGLEVPPNPLRDTDTDTSVATS